MKVSNSQSNEATFTWYLEAYEQEGNLFLKWSTNAPFRAQEDKILVYKNGWPSNPDSSAETWNYAEKDRSPWNTGLRWGSNWYCARIAQSNSGSFVYVNQIVTRKNG